jgi:hypothetical protein
MLLEEAERKQMGKLEGKTALITGGELSSTEQ